MFSYRFYIYLYFYRRYKLEVLTASGTLLAKKKKKPSGKKGREPTDQNVGFSAKKKKSSYAIVMVMISRLDSRALVLMTLESVVFAKVIVKDWKTMKTSSADALLTFLPSAHEQQLIS